MHYTNYSRKLLFHVDRVAGLFGGEPQPPVNVEIDLSNRCSLGCQSCHFAHTHTKGPLASVNRDDRQGLGDLMPSELAHRVLRELQEYGVRSVTWTGGGEPTLHPDFAQIIRHGQALGIDMGIYTSGVHVDLKMADLLGSAMRWVYISLDCHTQRSYVMEKGRDAFHPACDAVRLLRDTEATVGVGFLLHCSNYHHMQDMADLANDLGASYVQFRPTINFASDQPNRPVGARKWISKVLSTEVISKIPVELDKNRFVELEKWDGHGYDYCFWSGLQAVITPNGKVWTCCNKRGFEGEEIGDLDKERFDAIWGRRSIARVNDQCRVMCRGHMPNLVLHQITMPRDHANFI